MTYLTEEVGHISYVVDPRRESLRIQIEDILYKRLFFGWGQIMLDIAFFGLWGTALHSIAEGGLRDIVRLCSTSDRHLLVCTDSLDDKENSGFLGLRVHRVVVLWLHTIVRRSRCGRKVCQTLVCVRRL